MSRIQIRNIVTNFAITITGILFGLLIGILFGLLVASGLWGIGKFVWGTFRPPTPHATNETDAFYDANWGSVFPKKNSIATVDENSNFTRFEMSSNGVPHTHWTFSTNYLSVENPNEVTITFHGKDGSTWTPEWKKGVFATPGFTGPTSHQTVEHSGAVSTGWSKPGTELNTVWYVAISGLPRVIKLRARHRLDAAASTGLITVWSEEEWNDRPTLPGFVTEIEDATK